jgi:hypothetical protein
MLFQDPGTVAIVRPADPQYGGSLAAATRAVGRGDFFDVLRREVGDIRVGSARYRLRSPLLASFYPVIQGPEGRLMVTPALLPIVGSGAGFDEAWRDWAEQFHVRFQTLLAMRPWEMQPDQSEEWERIEQMVNVEAYRRETPYVIRQIGVLTRRRPIPNTIRWEDGRQERVGLEQMPPEFASLHEGQRFEAEVVRNAVTHQLIQAVVVRRLPPLRTTSEDEALWASLPTTKEAKPVDWDEFE